MSNRKKRKISSDNESVPTGKAEDDEHNKSDLSQKSVSSISEAEQEEIQELFSQEKNDVKESPSKNKEQPQLIKMDSLKIALKNLNLARKSSSHDDYTFDLETIYKNEKEFEIDYNDDTDTSNIKEYEIKDIKFPHEKNADYLLMVLIETFSNPVNCIYFTKKELDSILSFFTLSPEAQSLFARLLKRKLTWHRIKGLKYSEVAKDLNPFFKELTEKNFCQSDLKTVDITVLLNMLPNDELKDCCKKLKLDHRGNKADIMNNLLKYGKTVKKSFFTGAKSSEAVLRSMASSVLGPCVSLTENIIDVFDRILTLFYPTQDPSESISDLFFMLGGVAYGEIIFPPLNNIKFYPVFKNRSHFIEYVKSRNTYKDEINNMESKAWNSVREQGRLALEQLLKGEKRDEKSSIPFHVKKFEPEYLWMKVLCKSIDAFKKTPETIPEAVKILRTLIDDEHFSRSSKGRWYRELALIEMHHLKNLEESASLTLHALKEVKLSDVDTSDLIERVRKLIRRKNGISEKTRKALEKAHDEMTEQGLAPMPSADKTIVANMANKITNAGKSKWSINVNGRDKFYGSVELLVLQHYTSEEDYHQGLHVEGSLPVTLFGVFFWDELYNTSIPGAFLSPYQDAPLDLFTAGFYYNRKELIDEKLKFVRSLDEETFADWMHERYVNYHQYRSLISNILFKDDEQFKDVVTCLGINGVAGICEKLVGNYVLWRSGFPDLIVWNKLTSTCKIVEVKGPGDTLSEKQKHWLQYLTMIGVPAEVCHVEAAGSDSK